MKYFISQKMRGRSDEEILSERKKVVEAILKMNPDAEFIDSVLSVSGKPPLWYLGRSLQLLSEADMCVFVDNATENRGCRMERDACQLYGIDACLFRTDNGEFEAEGA